MSEFVVEDWKLKTRAVVKLYRKNTDKVAKMCVFCHNSLHCDVWAYDCKLHKEKQSCYALT